MRILILGVTGLLGHYAYRMFSDLGYDVVGTTRKKLWELQSLGIYKDNVDGEVCFLNEKSVYKSIDNHKPDVVLNCIGLTHHVTKDPVEMIQVNALMPHKIQRKCDSCGIKFVQISTDCVFSGKDGDYRETTPSDCSDLYGRTKSLGEFNSDRSLVIRTSFIGREIGTSYGLLEWFLKQNESVTGYHNVFWNGLSAPELIRTIDKMIKMNVSGLYNVGGETINKYELLCLIKKHFKKDIEIKRGYLTLYSNKTLNLDKFNTLNISIPSIEQMVEELSYA